MPRAPTKAMQSLRSQLFLYHFRPAIIPSTQALKGSRFPFLAMPFSKTSMSNCLPAFRVTESARTGSVGGSRHILGQRMPWHRTN